MFDYPKYFLILLFLKIETVLENTYQISLKNLKKKCTMICFSFSYTWDLIEILIWLSFDFFD